MRNRLRAVRGMLCAAIFFLLPSLIRAQAPSIAPRITAAINANARTVIPRSTHPLALPAFEVGRLDGSTRMDRMILVLGISSDADHQLSVLLDSQQTQGSPDYHQWLTPDQFGQQFGPAPQDIQTVANWLQQQGFSVGSVARSGRWIEFSGTAAQVEAAFQTQMHNYRVNGEAHVANSTDISIPTALAPVVKGVVSLHNFFSKPAFVQGSLARPGTDGLYHPITGDSDLSGGIHGLAPADFAKIYDVPNALLSPAPATVLNGTGETIAIVARSDISSTDVANFHTVFGVNAPAPNFILDGADPGVVSGDMVETTLDTEWSSAVAPGATIDVVISASTLIADGVDLSAGYIVDHNLGQILSASFNDCELAGGSPTEPGTENFYLNALWQQAAAQGISVFVSSGDSGAAACDPSGAGSTGAQNGAAVSGLASTPFDTAVGGTEFNETGIGESPNPGTTEATFWSATNGTNLESALGYIPEMVWNDSCTPTQVGSPCDTMGSTVDGSFLLAADGGGPSSIYSTPSYQTLNVTGLQSALSPFFVSGSTTIHPRGIPDVSMSASPDNDPYLICINASCANTSSPEVLLVGGTSAPTPSFAGIMAIVDQKIGTQQGLANYVLYPLAASETFANCKSNARTNPATATNCVFNDVTVGNNGVPGNDIAANGGDPTANALGYPATAGYDLATGLGSVDVGNLVRAWSGVTFQGSATSITPTTSINITHGATVNLTVDVTKAPSGSGPTGNVSLIAEGGNLPNTVGVAASALSSGTASFSVNNLPGGTSYNLIASYPGDGTFAGSTSNAITVTVAKEASAVELIDALPTSTELTNSPISTTYGFPIAFEALISGESSAESSTGDGQATGSVTFTDTLGSTTTNLATVNLNDFKSISVGGAEFFACSADQFCLAPGSYTINAAYSGDNSYLAGNSSSGGFELSVTIASASTNVTVSSPSAGSSVTSSTQVSLTATVSAESAGAAPNGTVTFFSGNTQLGNPVAVTGTAGTINFSGEGNFASASASLTTTLPVGTDSITAKYNGDTGDTNYAASSASPSITITVTGTTPSFTISANPTTVTVPAPGDSGSTVLTFTGQNGFSSNGAVMITASDAGLPSEANCAFAAGTSVTIPTNGTAMATLTCTTTAPSSLIGPGSRSKPDDYGDWKLLMALTLVCLLGIALLTLSRDKRRRRWSFALVLFACGMIAIAVGCGGGGGGTQPPQNPGTPISDSPVTVMVTINGVAESVPIMLDVN